MALHRRGRRRGLNPPVSRRLLATIEYELPDADPKVWHAYPVWFFDCNPMVGYDRPKASVRLLLSSGQSFREPTRTAKGTFQAAEAAYTAPEQVDIEALRRWLSEARDVEAKDRDIRTNRGVVPERGTGS